MNRREVYRDSLNSEQREVLYRIYDIGKLILLREWRGVFSQSSTDIEKIDTVDDNVYSFKEESLHRISNACKNADWEEEVLKELPILGKIVFGDGASCDLFIESMSNILHS